MRSPLRKTVLTTALAATSLAAPGAASAATNPYSAERICGPSYTLAQSITVRSMNRAVIMGNLKLLYSGQTGRSCGVMLKARQIGRPTFTSVSVFTKARPKRLITDSGPYRYYAGPVYAQGTPACVRIGGYMSVPFGREGIFVEPSWNGCP